MKYLLVAYFLSSGQYTQSFATHDDCKDVLIEASIMKGPDLWSAVCVGPDDDVYASIGQEGISP
jgi:hypothetical protein